MNEQLIAFAKETPNAHIAIVEESNARRLYQWSGVQSQLSDAIERTYPFEFKLKLINGTLVYFFVVPLREQIQGLQFDRIETSPASVFEHPTFFKCRLKPNVKPDAGFSWRFLE